MALALALAALAVASAHARAQGPAGAPPAQHPDAGTQHAAAEVSAAPDSPRASLARFLELERKGRHDQAARYLDLPKPETAQGPELARELKAVLDRYVWFDLAAISASPRGDENDGLPPLVDEIAKIPGPSGSSEPVRLVRRQRDGATRWLFSSDVVTRIDAWYGRLEHRYLREHLPPALFQPGPKELLWWQWIALIPILLLSWLLAKLLNRIGRFIAERVAARTSATWDDVLVDRLSGPMGMVFTLALTYVGVLWLTLDAPALSFVERTLRGFFFVAFFWGLARSIDVAHQVLMVSEWGRTRSASRSLMTVFARSGKVAVLAMAVVALLSELGYPVASLVAGLGIGGLAMALAAQKTVENLFGAFSIAADQPFREGDFVKVEDFVGTVETIGLRSTKIRTLDRTLITMPNGRLSDMRLESFAARDRIRLSCVLGLVYSTTGAQMRSILEGLERVLREHPKTWQEAVIVRFREFGESSLDIEIMSWFETADFGQFQLFRQEVLLAFMDVVEQAGSSFAFPTRTLHVEHEPAPAATPRA